MQIFNQWNYSIKLEPMKGDNIVPPHLIITKSFVNNDHSFLPLYICAERQVPIPQKIYIGILTSVTVLIDVLTSYLSIPTNVPIKSK